MNPSVWIDYCILRTGNTTHKPEKEHISINANTTGAFSDTTPHNDSIATGDLIAVKVVAGSSALIIDIIACTFAARPSSKYGHSSSNLSM